MKTDLFDYELPEELIAQVPIERRDASRLMVVECGTTSISHHRFDELPGFLSPGDCLVINTSRVIPARLRARKTGTGGFVELLLLEKLSPGRWKAIYRGARLRPGSTMELDKGVTAEVEKGRADGEVVVAFGVKDGDALNIEERLESLGEVPLPPYIHRPLDDSERYQTVYCEREISAAAPSAGLHFTPELLTSIEGEGVTVARLELAVGIDTFVPVREEDTEDHRMHREWYSLGEDCAGALNACQGRVVAVGTTVVRALESAAVEAGKDGRMVPSSGRTSLFITPGYRFRAVDAVVTNFHFPRSTLIMLVAAFAGRELLLDAYRLAVDERYRFYSFGDAMLVLAQERRPRHSPVVTLTS